MNGSNIKQGVEIPTHISLIGGSISGLVSRFIIAPIDIIKIRLQLNSSKGVWNTLILIIKNEGVKSLWKGNIPAELMYLIYGASQFTLYSSLNTMLFQNEVKYNLKIDNSMHSLIIGSASGCISTFISYPFDVLRTKLASNKSRKFKSFPKECISIFQRNGIVGFYSGCFISMNYVTISMGLSFGTYSKLRELTKGTTKTIEQSSGLIAGALSKFIIYPLDLIRRRRQFDNFTSTKNIITTVFKNEGIFGFYHGLTPAIVKTAPTTAISLWCYEYSVDLLLKLEKSTLKA
ncbi:hypothetical protein CANARDRAFT_201971 [[Candida] arabinofermentans NRRL YB-2248]|uniref:Mitochondrial thiamine pyrophosphate carrier 1 n=1 Tax=[Candida] arabinofermentans NRRL YB-2248 TaxID=983967 RepID=A0A1E4SWV5_9ASCO|nr:hypothetical protein CANARDRAFT_201971 [[Candida] arabinofermentans NRRL YB-2248]